MMPLRARSMLALALLRRCTLLCVVHYLNLCTAVCCVLLGAHGRPGGGLGSQAEVHQRARAHAHRERVRQVRLTVMERRLRGGLGRAASCFRVLVVGADAAWRAARRARAPATSISTGWCGTRRWHRHSGQRAQRRALGFARGRRVFWRLGALTLSSRNRAGAAARAVPAAAYGRGGGGSGGATDLRGTLLRRSLLHALRFMRTALRRARADVTRAGEASGARGRGGSAHGAQPAEAAEEEGATVDACRTAHPQLLTRVSHRAQDKRKGKKPRTEGGGDGAAGGSSSDESDGGGAAAGAAAEDLD